MRKVREILRLKWELGLGLRDVARSVAISHSTVLGLIHRAEAAGLSWPLPEDLDDERLEALLYPGEPSGEQRRPELDMERIHQELRRKGVTLQLLWLEYKREHPDGYQYSQFCSRYNQWLGRQDTALRQVYPPGEQMALDYSGVTMPVIDRQTGEIRQAQVFVATLCASNYTFAEATWTQSQRDWIGSNCRAFEFFRGVTRLVVLDNLKAGVKRACAYEPDLNPTYSEMAAHYGVGLLPARPKKPRDKAKVETAVQIVERWVLAPLRHRQFFTLAELNQAIAEQLKALNERPFQKSDGTRLSLYETVERPALRPLPPTRYEFAEWRKATVNIDYHVAVEHNFYSVPYQLVHEEVDVRLGDTVVEIYHRGKRVASHPRSFGRGVYVTRAEHRPAAHQRYLDWTPSRLIQWGETVGPRTGELFKLILEAKPHPEQGFRSCLGLLRLGKEHTIVRLEAACSRALAINTPSYRSVKSILENGLDKMPLPESAAAAPAVMHENVRGPEYYARGDQPC